MIDNVLPRNERDTGLAISMLMLWWIVFVMDDIPFYDNTFQGVIATAVLGIYYIPIASSAKYIAFWLRWNCLFGDTLYATGA